MDEREQLRLSCSRLLKNPPTDSTSATNGLRELWKLIVAIADAERIEDVEPFPFWATVRPDPFTDSDHVNVEWFAKSVRDALRWESETASSTATDVPTEALEAWDFERPGVAIFRGVEFPVKGQIRKLLVKLASRNRAFTANELWDAMKDDDPARDVSFELSNVRQHISKLRTLLKATFDTTGDPVPCVDSDGDRTAWKLDAATLSPKSAFQKS